MDLCIEKHPFTPFLPSNAKVLFLGSFPPQKKRWSMPFYYPNYTNDFWYMVGLLWFQDKHYFTIPSEKRFDYEKIVEFCNRVGFAMYDTAKEVRRLKNNASDQFLEVVTPTNLAELLAAIPACASIVTTGQKATDIIVNTYHSDSPAIGDSVNLSIPVRLDNGGYDEKQYRFYRMPSTSRAYPLPLVQKAQTYLKMFNEIGIL